MKEILIFAGTTEGRRLSECLAESGIVHTICVATEYGEIVLKPHPMVKVHRGRMNREEIREFITTGEFAAVVDATHPYAEVVTENIKAAMERMDIPYLRLKRETDEKQNMDTALFGTNEECLKALEQTEGNILLTTGSKELGIYFYMMTGGEPLVRKADIIRLCEKHNDCAFHCYTNGTLVDEKLCEDMKRVGNLSLSISLEGFEDANDFRRGEGVYNKVLHAMDLLHENGLIFGNSVCYTSKNMDAVTSDEFFDLLIEHGSRFAWYFHLMPVGMKASPELMPTKEQREYIYHRLREVRGFEGGKEIFVMDFQNDGEYVGGCIAGGRNYCHINPKGDVEPCVFIHYSGANIREKSLLECLKQPLFMAYRDNQPFNENMLRPCPMLENPEILQKMVHETGAHSTDVEQEEPVEHLCGKCVDYAKDWKETADKLWAAHPYKQKGYTNFKKK